MENELNTTYQNNEQEEKYETPQNPKLLTNKAKNSLINLLSFLINNKNDFNEKIKPSELEIKLITDSDMSFTNQLIYKIQINYLSFNEKRDIVKNMSKYKKIPTDVELRDEYYGTKNIFKNINLNFIPTIKKGINLDLSIFPFYSFNKENKKEDKFKFKLGNNINNKFILCIYVIQTDDITINKIDKNIESLNKMKNIWDYFEKVYVIFQINTYEQISRLAGNNKINKYIFIDNNDQNNKIIYLFNILSIYELNDSNENLINIFLNKSNIKEKGKEYFFILDQKNKIIKLKNLSDLSETLSYFLFNLKNDTKNNSYIPKEKEMNKKIKIIKMKELLYFISKLKNLDYIFNLDFKISMNISINDELTKIELKKINSITMNGKFFKKEYNYLMGLYNFIRQKNCNFNASEIPTIDIDIDFTKMVCDKCSTIIPEDIYLYYCYKCKTKYCYECVQKQLNNNKGKAKYIDKKHNLIFFKTRDKKQFLNIETSKLGQNKFAQCTNDNDFDNKHNAECFGCKGNFMGTERYICLKCRRGIIGGNTFIDYCGKCIEKMCKDREEMIKLEKEANTTFYNHDSNNFTTDHKITANHKHEEHIYLMLPLQYKQEDYEPYYNF